MLLIASFPPLSLSLSRSLNLSPSPPFSSPHCASAFTLRLTSSPHSVHRPLSPDMYPLDLTCTLKRELGQSLLTLYRITTARPAAPSPLSSAPYLPLAAAHPPAPTHRVAAQAISPRCSRLRRCAPRRSAWSPSTHRSKGQFFDVRGTGPLLASHHTACRLTLARLLMSLSGQRRCRLIVLNSPRPLVARHFLPNVASAALLDERALATCYSPSHDSPSTSYFIPREAWLRATLLKTGSARLACCSRFIGSQHQHYVPHAVCCPPLFLSISNTRFLRAFFMLNAWISRFRRSFSGSSSIVVFNGPIYGIAMKEYESSSIFSSKFVRVKESGVCVCGAMQSVLVRNP